MSEVEQIDKMVSALRKVPAADLLIVRLANEIPIVKGGFDYAEVKKRQFEVNLALQEAKVFGSQTLMAVDCLIRIKGVNEHVGPEPINPDE